MTQTQLCLLDKFEYNVTGALENVSNFVDDLKKSAGAPEAILIPTGRDGAGFKSSGADGQDCKRFDGGSNKGWKCSNALKHEEALLRHKTFKWSHRHANNGAQTWEQHLSCDMRLLLYEIYSDDFQELARLGFNFTKDLCVRDGGERLEPTYLNASK